MGLFNKKPNRLPQPNQAQVLNYELENKKPIERQAQKIGKEFVVKAPFDDILPDVIQTFMYSGYISVSAVQREFKLGYGKAARIIDQMWEAGLVSEFSGSEPRRILYRETDTIKYVENEEESDEVPSFGASDFFKYGGVDAELLTADLMDGHDFERWCANLLLRNGFDKAAVTPGSGDFGVDIVAEKDGIRYAIQCKCYSSTLGNTPVQEVFAGKEMYDCHIGVVMTNRNFSDGAVQLAKKTKVLLWDRDKLQFLIESGV